ncbi:LuxR C-terminal-related transcriptional regulator [Streptomyces sp. NPDC050504]|uniref:helix-turn-helix transcriptional regulator n=1 Tax=Streptomyces sp. NPDC050504 TaxID=3365618 RepID=UPI0037AD0AC4
MLTGRGEQLTKLADEFSRCLSRNAGVVLIQGLAGLGKTTILNEFSQHLEKRGATVLRGSGRPGDHEAPAAPHKLLDQALHGVAAHVPVVVLVDDVQHVPAPELRRLLTAVRSAHARPLLLVLTEAVQEWHGDPALRTLVLQHPNLLRIFLPPLRPHDVADVLGEAFGESGEESACHRAMAWHAVSGGNPLLLAALLEDHHTATAQQRSPSPAEPQTGAAFSAAVRGILKRSDRIAEDLVRALAVLGRAASPELLSLMLDVSRGTVTRGIQTLTATGLLDGCALRHPLVRTALLDEMAPQARAALHLCAAEHLHRTGGRPLDVAEHLLAAGPSAASDPWVVDVLRGAAEHVLASDVPLAVKYLELACVLCAAPAQRAELRLRLAAVVLRLDPSAVEAHLVEPLVLLDDGRLPECCSGPLARLLFALGRVEEARRTLNRFSAAGGSTGGSAGDSTGGDAGGSTAGGGPEGVPGAAAPAAKAPAEAAALHPATAQVHPLFGTAPAASPAAPVVALPGLAPVRPVRGEPAALVAEGSLPLLALTEATFEPAVTALFSLARGNRRPAEIEAWWQLLTGEAQGWQTPGWQTILTMIRGEIALWQGDLPKAVEYAGASLEGAAEEIGSVFAAGAIATQVLAYTAMGRLGAAARQLSRPVRDSVFRSVYGLKYLRARGHYYLATGRAHAALGEFLTAGRLAKQWSVDQPVLLPWNTDAAEAWLRIGEREPAERLLRGQLGEIGSSRVRGAALRLHAGLGEPGRRTRTLALAVAELEKSGDRLELARALADLGRAHWALGEFSRAGAITDRAWQLAKECGADALCEAIRPGRLKAHEQSRADDDASSPLSKLSDSEVRVAALAAQGSTNREIAAELYITVSTVEQHLTRVYRKLNIRGRRQLTMDFGLNHLPLASEIA